MQSMMVNPSYREIFLKFIEEWNDLRPIDRNKLLGKPLQLPLNLELCYLKEATNHGREVCIYQIIVLFFEVCVNFLYYVWELL